MESRSETFKDITTYNENGFFLCIMRKSKHKIQSNRFIAMEGRNKERDRRRIEVSITNEYLRTPLVENNKGKQLK